MGSAAVNSTTRVGGRELKLKFGPQPLANLAASPAEAASCRHAADASNNAYASTGGYIAPGPLYFTSMHALLELCTAKHQYQAATHCLQSCMDSMLTTPSPCPTSAGTAVPGAAGRLATMLR